MKAKIVKNLFYRDPDASPFSLMCKYSDVTQPEFEIGELLMNISGPTAERNKSDSGN